VKIRQIRHPKAEAILHQEGKKALAKELLPLLKMYRCKIKFRLKLPPRVISVCQRRRRDTSIL